MKNLVRDGFRGMVLFGIGFLACALSTLNFQHGDKAFAASKQPAAESALRILSAPAAPVSAPRPPRAYAYTYFQMVDETTPPGWMAFGMIYFLAQNNGAITTSSSSTFITVDMSQPRQQVEMALREGVAAFINEVLAAEGNFDFVYTADDIFGIKM